MSRTSPRSPRGSLSTIKRSGSKMSAVCRMIDERIANVSSISICRFSETYSPLRSLMTPGTRTKSTLERKSKLPIMGEPERISTETAGSASTKECAIARHRRRCPSPKLSWL